MVVCPVCGSSFGEEDAGRSRYSSGVGRWHGCPCGRLRLLTDGLDGGKPFAATAVAMVEPSHSLFQKANSVTVDRDGVRYRDGNGNLSVVLTSERAWNLVLDLVELMTAHSVLGS